MPATVLEKARLSFKSVSNFIEGPPKLSNGVPLPSLQSGTWVGMYRNKNENEAVLISSEAIYILVNSKWDVIEFNSVSKMNAPSKYSPEDILNIQLIDGSTKKVPITGRKGPEGKFRDVFLFLRFLMKVTNTK